MFLHVSIRRFLASLCVASIATSAIAAGKAKHVVLIVWDGMRPDFVTEEYTPSLHRLLQRGVFFQNHHSVFVSSTEVNGTVFGTGMNPRTSGVMANYEYRPAIDPLNSVATEALTTVRRGDLVSHDQYLHAATVAEILRAQNPAQPTSIAGTKPVALLLDRKERPNDSTSRLLAEGVTQPAADAARIASVQGEFPPINADQTKIDRDAWTARALLEHYWADGIPPYSVLWLAEPDWSQHTMGPGSPNALAGIKSSDAKLGQVLAVLAARHALDDTDVMIVSDHGFSTIESVPDVARDLSLIGLTTGRAFTRKPAPGDVLVVGNGGSANLYVIGHDAQVVQRIVEYLQSRDYTGVLFTRQGEHGTFPLSLAKIDSPDAPDIVVSFRWHAGKSATGTPGMEASEVGGRRSVGQGNHASLSRYDLHNALVAAGPDFKRGIVNPLPSGNIDVAPTILWILGATPPKPMEGRILTEALTIDGPPLTSFEIKRHETSQRLGNATWRQYLNVSEVNGVTYFDEGNGAAVTDQP